MGLEVEFDRAVAALARADGIALGVGEQLPFAADSFDLILSNEVLDVYKRQGELQPNGVYLAGWVEVVCAGEDADCAP